MKESMYQYREGSDDNITFAFWVRKKINTQTIRNSLLTLELAGEMTLHQESIHMLSKRNGGWAFYMVTHGKGSFRLHRKTIYFSPGDIIVVAPQFVNVIFSISSNSLTLQCLCVTDSIGVHHMFIQDVPEVSLFRPLDFEKTHYLYQSIMKKMKNQLLSSISECSILQDVFAFLYEIEHQGIAMEYVDTIQAIYNEINNFPDRPYSIPGLAQKSGLGTRTLQKRFKKQIGCSIQSLITICRIGLARQLLQSTFLSISEIAGRCCYKDAAFFSKTFKQKTGMSPNEFRTRNSSKTTFTSTSNLASGLKLLKTGGVNELSPRKKQLLWLINEQRNISINKLAEKMGINPSAVQKHINFLKEAKILQRSGPKRGGLWIISKP